MLIFGHPLVESFDFFGIEKIEDIEKSSPKSVVFFSFDEKNVYLARYCQDNDINFAVFIKDLKELLIANLWRAKYALVKSDFAKEAQKIAETYLFDMKIILQIETQEEMIWAAKEGIDGVIFKESIKFI